VRGDATHDQRHQRRRASDLDARANHSSLTGRRRIFDGRTSEVNKAMIIDGALVVRLPDTDKRHYKTRTLAPSGVLSSSSDGRSMCLRACRDECPRRTTGTRARRSQQRSEEIGSFVDKQAARAPALRSDTVGRCQSPPPVNTGRRPLSAGHRARPHSSGPRIELSCSTTTPVNDTRHPALQRLHRQSTEHVAPIQPRDKSCTKGALSPPMQTKRLGG
jgi:hypothetical protein